MSKAIGILGGMGPAATVDLMARLIAATPVSREADHLRLFVDCNPHVPNRNEALAGAGDYPGDALIAMAQGLERQGADLLAIACNSAHAWADEIRASTGVPLVSMIDATMAAIPADALRIGLLAADACLQARLYQAPLEQGGREVMMPDDQAAFMRLIYGAKTGHTGAEARAAMAALARGLIDRGAEVIVAACTEVPLLLSASDIGVPLVDSTDALVRRLIAEATA
ncbi:aspartate racemase [Nostoc sp. 3335mG]|nr:aspartate racemase [Nostoc sp. 3335mG]